MERKEFPRRGGWRLFAPLLLLPLAACFQHTYAIGAGAPAAPVVHDEWRHHWLVGLISPEHELDLEQVCSGSNDATIHQEQTFLNGLVAILTAGIYVPRTVEVRCAGGGADLELNEDEVRRIVSEPVFLDRVEALLPGRVEAARVARSAFLKQ